MLEPGLLSSFRLLLGIRLLIQLVAIATELTLGQNLQPYRALAFVETLLLAGYLSLPVFHRWLSNVYLPLAIVVASAGPLVGNALFVWLDSRTGLTRSVSTISQWELVLVLLPPLIVTAWQYSFGAVAAFAAGTGLLHLGLYLATANPRPGAVASLILEVLVLRTMMFMLIGYLVVRLANAQRAQRDALTQANARLVHYSTAVEKLTLSHERNRLARELHDTLAHSLSEIAVQLEALKTIWQKDTLRARKILEQALIATRDGLHETRRAIRALRAAPLEDLGLTLAIRALVESAEARVLLKAVVRIPDEIEDIPEEVEQCFYRVAQEAIANVVEHSHANHLRVELERKDGYLSLLVADNGCGFDIVAVDSNGCYGLTGLRERAQMIGAELSIESAPARGTSVRLILEEIT